MKHKSAHPLLVLSSRSMHQSAWKVNSANFAFTEFSEVRFRQQTQATAKRYGHLAYIHDVL